MKLYTLTAALLGSACILGCGKIHEAHDENGGHESAAPEALADPELPSQEEIDRKAAEQIDAGNADEEYKKLLEEMEREG